MYDKICPECGTRLSQFYKTSMLGCPTCYKAFEREIVLALKKIQGQTLHVGKTPYSTELDKKLLNEYQTLIKEKERAVIEKRFDDANEIADQILYLSEELKRRGLI
jgi:protein arginine kinase activator